MIQSNFNWVSLSSRFLFTSVHIKDTINLIFLSINVKVQVQHKYLRKSISSPSAAANDGDSWINLSKYQFFKFERSIRLNRFWHANHLLESILWPSELDRKNLFQITLIFALSIFFLAHLVDNFVFLTFLESLLHV